MIESGEGRGDSASLHWPNNIISLREQTVRLTKNNITNTFKLEVDTCILRVDVCKELKSYSRFIALHDNLRTKFLAFQLTCWLHSKLR